MNSKYKVITICILFILFAKIVFSQQISEGKDLHFVNEHWPPYIIVDAAGHVGGIDLEILREIAKQLKVELKISVCDWVYCLKMIENGRADIISAALKRSDREKYMHYIEPPYLLKSTKIFYLQSGKGHLIQKYEDIYNLTVGVLKGSAYFSPFDDDHKINKIEALKTEQLLLMLKAGRLDAVIGTELVTDQLILSRKYLGLFEKSVYRYEKETPFHFGISKKSPFAEYLPQLNKIMASLVREGKVQSIIKKYIGK